jgi:hypothetical protein
MWTANERTKYRRFKSGELFKFVGFAPYCDEPLKRGALLADAGFCPELRDGGNGYAVHSWCEGQPFQRSAGRSMILPRLLDYLAFRQRACRVDTATSDALETMLHVNISEALGVTPPRRLRLDVECPVHVDGRLLPHEWIEPNGGLAIKVDAIDHADDHLLPGPCDSAWDVAGAVVEWDLSRAETTDFVARYHELTGDDVARRLRPYVLAYAAFRVGYFSTALLSAEAREQTRLLAERERHRRILACYLESSPSS